MRVFVGLPIFNLQDPKVAESQQILFNSTKHQLFINRVIGANVEHARQILMKRFLNSDCEYFFCIDADNFVLENPYPDLIDHLISLDKDVVGGVYVFKRSPFLPVFRPLDLQKEYEEKRSFPKDYKFKIPNELFEVCWIGGGFKMVKRNVCEKLQEVYKFPNLPMEYKGEYVSEDWSFDIRAREQGFTIWADPTFKLAHLGSCNYTIENYGGN